MRYLNINNFVGSALTKNMTESIPANLFYTFWGIYWILKKFFFQSMNYRKLKVSKSMLLTNYQN